MTLRSLNDWVVKLLLMPVDGVTDVLSFGGAVQQYQVHVDPKRLLAYRLAIGDVATAIEANNRNAGGWYLDRGAEQLVIRGVGWVRAGEDGVRDIANVPLTATDGVPVRVRDVARIALGPEIRQGAVTMTIRDAQGTPKVLDEVVAGIVLKRMHANTKATIDSVNARLPIIQQALPAGVIIEPFYDQADLVSQAVHTVAKALLQAFGLIVIVLTLFLMNLRATLLVLISIPLSVALALTVMAWWGLSANLMSLGGLAIAIGMLVDGAVVMIENIFKNIARPQQPSGPIVEDTDDANPSIGFQHDDDLRGRIEQSARQMGRPVFFAVLIVMVVFTPLFTLEGVEGKLFQPMAISIVLAMLASLMVALFVVPALATYAFRHPVKHRLSLVNAPIEWLYRHALAWTLRRPWLVILLAVALLAGALALITRLGTEFVPELEEGTLNIRVTLSPSSSLETALSVARKMEARLLEFPEVTYASSRIGRAELGGDPEPVSNIEIYVGLLPLHEWTSANSRLELQRLMKAKMAVHPGLLFSFSQPIATRVDELLSGVKAQLAVKLFGPDLRSAGR